MKNLEQEHNQKADREILSRMILVNRQKKAKEDLQSVLKSRSEALEVLRGNKGKK